jgi:hypothetical protein
MVDLIVPYDENLRNYVDARDYTKIARVVQNDTAIVYVDGTRIDEVMQDLGIVRSNIMPTVLTLLGRAELQASGILQVQEQPYLDLRGTDVLIRIYRYRN